MYWCGTCPLRPTELLTGSAAPQELLAEWQLRRASRSMCGRLRQATVLAVVWLLCLGAAMGCAVAVLAFSEVTIQVRQGPLSGGASCP